MRRREFMALVGGLAFTCPLGARAQPATPVIGFLSADSLQLDGIRLAGLRQGLKESGYVEGRNLAIEYRGAEGRPDRLPALATDLIHHPVSVIMTAGVTAAIAAKAATTTVPIVFTIAGDPVELGLVASVKSPGGNVTGVDSLTSTAIAKQIELLHEIVPGEAPLGLLVNPTSALAEIEIRQVQATAQAVGRKLLVVSVTEENGIEPAFDALAQGRVSAAAIGSNPLFNSRFNLLAMLAVRHTLPMVCTVREFAVAGGLMSYGTNLAEGYRLTRLRLRPTRYISTT
jgi:putative ABC transport system substrate-binding protein